MPFDHYVSQAILKRWGDPREADPKVWVYTFESGDMVQREVARLFGREGLNRPDLEKKLGALWESPLTRFRLKDLRFRHEDFEGLRSGPRKHLLNNRAERRALGLAFVIQRARAEDALRPGSDALSQLLRQPDPVLQYVTDKFLSTYRLSTISMLESHVLLLPECGYFEFPVSDRTAPRGQGVALALPLEPRVALLAVPVACQENTDDSRFIATLAAYSVGVKDRAVVLPSAVVATAVNANRSLQDVARDIVKSRAQVLENRKSSPIPVVTSV